LSLEAPTRIVEYSAAGSSWTDISDNVIDFDLWLRDLAEGMSEFTVTLDNKDGVFSQTTFPAFGSEAGLHYYMRFRLNGVYRLVGRISSLEPVLQDKDIFKIHGRCLGQQLTNLLIEDEWRDKKADDLIADMLTKAKANEIVFSSPSTAPIVTISTMQNPRYLADIIREICELIDYAAFVKTQAAVTQGTLLFFPKADTGKRHSTVLKNVLYASDNNVQSFNLKRSIDEVKNECTFVGGMSYSEPANMDAWTETTKGWYRNEITSLYQDQAYAAPILGIGGASLSTYSILGVTYSKIGPWFGLDIPAVLGDYFNCSERSADFLHFWYGVKPGLELSLIGAVCPKVFLQDADGNRIYRFLGMVASIDSESWADNVWFLVHGGWQEYVAPIGWSTSIYDYLNPDPDTARDWYFDTGFHTFNWDKVRLIEFQDCQASQNRSSEQQNFLWIDGLYFHQAYQPKYIAKNQESINKYGLRMERPSTVDFVELSDLKAWADKVILATSKPTLLLDVDALLNPASEALYPAYSIGLNIPRLGITAGSPYFRILEIHYRWFNQGLQTSFSLLPSTVA